MCVHVLFHLFCMIFNSLSCSALLLLASCGELTQFKAQPRSEEQPAWLSELVKPCSHETVLPGSGNVILIQPFSAQRRKIKRRGREEMERAHTQEGVESWGRDFCPRPVIRTEPGLPCASVVLHRRPLGGYGSSVPHGVLMKWLLTSRVPNALEAKWANTERERGREGESRHDRSSTAKRAVPDYCHFNEKSEGRYKQAKVSASYSFSWAQTALLFNDGLTLVNNMQNNNAKMWTVVIGYFNYLAHCMAFPV